MPSCHSKAFYPRPANRGGLTLVSEGIEALRFDFFSKQLFSKNSDLPFSIYPRLSSGVVDQLQERPSKVPQSVQLY